MIKKKEFHFPQNLHSSVSYQTKVKIIRQKLNINKKNLTIAMTAQIIKRVFI